MPTEASQGQIKKAYYQRARECHPDKHAGDDAKAEEFKRLSDAYQTLFDRVTTTGPSAKVLTALFRRCAAPPRERQPPGGEV